MHYARPSKYFQIAKWLYVIIKKVIVIEEYGNYMWMKIKYTWVEKIPKSSNISKIKTIRKSRNMKKSCIYENECRINISQISFWLKESGNVMKKINAIEKIWCIYQKKKQIERFA